MVQIDHQILGLNSENKSQTFKCSTLVLFCRQGLFNRSFIV